MKYVALLRGINSGKNPMIKMEVLRKAFEDMGFKNVKTVIASGNVIFDLPAGRQEPNKTSEKPLEIKIEKELPKYIGFESKTIIRSTENIQQLVDNNPFKNSTTSTRKYVTFVKDVTKKVEKLEGKGFEILATFPGAICYTIEENTKTPDIMGLLEKQFGKDITTRNWNTVGRILKASR